MVFQSQPVLHIVMTEKRFKLHDLILFPGQNIYPNNKDDVDKEYYEICTQQINETLRRFFFKMLILLAVYMGLHVFQFAPILC